MQPQQSAHPAPGSSRALGLRRSLSLRRGLCPGMVASRLSLCRCAVPHASLSSRHFWWPPHPPGISGGLSVSCPRICCPPGISGCLPCSCPPPSRPAPAMSPLPACSAARRTGDWAGISPGTHTTLSSQAQTPGMPQMLLEGPPRPAPRSPIHWPGPGPVAAPPQPRQQAGAEDWPAATAPQLLG